jgi:integrase
MASTYKRQWKGADNIARVRWVAAFKDQNGVRRNKSFMTRKEAKAYETLVGGEIVRGVHSPESASITVAEACALWLKRGELEQLERSTLRQYRIHVDHHIAPLIGAVKLARLSTPTVHAFRDVLLKTRSRAMARKIMASFKSIIGEAQRRGMVAQNAATPVKIEVKKRDQGKLQIGVDVPAKEEIAALINHAEDRWRPLFITAIFTGMRASELRGLPWDAVDFEHKVVHVRQRADAWRRCASGDSPVRRASSGWCSLPAPARSPATPTYRRGASRPSSAPPSARSVMDYTVCATSSHHGQSSRVSARSGCRRCSVTARSR